MSTHRVIPRSEWGARYGRGTAGKVKRDQVIIHTTVTALMSETASQASEAAVMRNMEHFHVSSRKFNGIAYSFCISDSGRIYEARGWTRDGAHTQGGGNTSGYGIAFIGDGTKRPPTRQAWEALVWLIATGIDQGFIARPYRLSGHRDWWRKACPGDMIYSIMNAKAGNVSSIPSRPSDWIFGPGDTKHDGVRVWQQQLVDGFGAQLKVDGDFGPITEAITKDFERTQAIAVNGYVSAVDTRAMEALYASLAKGGGDGSDEQETPPENVSPLPVLGRHYQTAVRYSANPVDERIARAIGAALNLHVARLDDSSTAEVVYLVGGQAVKNYDRKRAERVVEISGRNRTETLNEAVEVIRSYLAEL